MTAEITRCKLGDIRPSALMYAFGIGSVVDLPNLSAVVMGIDDWDITKCRDIQEDRLLAVVREKMGEQVEQLISPPTPPPARPGPRSPFDEANRVGIPVAPFPRWVVCPTCRLLAPLNSPFFVLKVEPYRPDRTRYVHENCNVPGMKPTVIPARFVVACTHGHLDDFPWVWFVHGGRTDCNWRLRLQEFGLYGEASGLRVVCDTCGKARGMQTAFEEENRARMPMCRGRRPHLRDFEEGCEERMQLVLLGASNSWFPLTESALSIPRVVNTLADLVEEHWEILSKAATPAILAAFRQIGQLRQFEGHSDAELWQAMEARRTMSPTDGQEAPVDLRVAEWEVFSAPDPERNTSDFRLREVAPPEAFGGVLERVVLAERLREVQAFLGFTRIEHPGDFHERAEIDADILGEISRGAPRWIPSAEVHGEGIFLQFREEAINRWQVEPKVMLRMRRLSDAHREWRRRRGLPDSDASFPGARYVLLHSVAHALMRQFALECGYSAASIRERLYSLPSAAEHGPMAGILLYTAAPDSEGTLGGLVSLGEPEELGRHLTQALAQVGICASDPLCSEHDPLDGGLTVHGAACHACLFVPETSCERGNRYLDRAVLVPTLSEGKIAFFDMPV